MKLKVHIFKLLNLSGGLQTYLEVVLVYEVNEREEERAIE